MVAEERRTIALADAGVQLRAAGDSGGQRFAGLAMQYGVRAAIGDPKGWGFFEEFAAAAAADSIATFDQRMLVDHDTYYLVSRVSAGDLALTDVSRGVEVDSELDEELSYVKDLRRNVERRRITGMSIGFRVRPGGYEWREIQVEEPRPDGKIEVYTADLRYITAIDLIEVSAVTFPAYADTEADLRWGVMPALLQRGDRRAIERRAVHRPELGELLALLREQRDAGNNLRPDIEAAIDRRMAHHARQLVKPGS